ncbi:predicted NAD/FAD-dependent oxidoreductase [Serpentinimonas raichei]|uniref:Predicted NAD/FAD-dependent oxidoreductase n=1 Tax=Serpentinimonas raichei TaxID=1458425 RepID=A0A060NJ09_9BURK|nr:FAD-dependent oxidoreductase [Serpentinimonas raichei]BAO81402.1 predicted NAD/FAD-dependent oxidoreductase [Serpentinimonas raichei]
MSRKPRREGGTPRTTPPDQAPRARRTAVVGAGMAGVVCARTLAQAGHEVLLLDKHHSPGGRMATRLTEFGGFDHGAQFFTVTDERFKKALALQPELIAQWQVPTVRVLDTLGQTLASASAIEKARWVGVRGMSELLRQWALPLSDGSLNASSHYNTQVVGIEPDALNPKQWQLRCAGAAGSQQVIAGLDQVLLALPAPQAQALLCASALVPEWVAALDAVETAPCWTLLLAFAQAAPGGPEPFGPNWHAASSDHHRIRWVARENSKPGRSTIERWTVQASPQWSAEHLEDDAERVKAKLLKGFAEVTGIRAEPTLAQVHRWRYAQTLRPLGQPCLWNPALGLGLSGDWCLGHRVENAFVSGLELALAAT